MTYDLEKDKYLWDGSQPGWVLLKAPDLAGGFCIFNEVTSTLLHIDDEEVNLLLCQHMRQNACKVIDAMPAKGSMD